MSECSCCLTSSYVESAGKLDMLTSICLIEASSCCLSVFERVEVADKALLGVDVFEAGADVASFGGIASPLGVEAAEFAAVGVSPVEADIVCASLANSCNPVVTGCVVVKDLGMLPELPVSHSSVADPQARCIPHLMQSFAFALFQAWHTEHCQASCVRCHQDDPTEEELSCRQ